MSTTTIKLLLLVVLLAAPCQAATQVIRYVDPDASGAGDGTSWTDAYTALADVATELTGKNIGVLDEKWTAYCRSSGGTADTTQFTTLGYTSSNAANYLEIIQTDAPADGVWSDTAYRLYNNDAFSGFGCDNNTYLVVRDLQIEVVQTGTNARRAWYCYQTDNATFDSLRIKATMGGANSNSEGLRFFGADNCVVYNCLIYGFTGGSAGIIAVSGSADIYNTTIYNCNRGIWYVGGVFSAVNCAVGNNGDDFAGAITVDHCCSDDGDGTNAVDLSPSGTESDDWAAAWTDPSNGDFHVKDTDSVLYDAGTADPGSGLYSDDIRGVSRSTWDIGAFEFGDDPGGGGQVMGTIIVKEHDILRGTRTGIGRGL